MIKNQQLSKFGMGSALGNKQCAQIQAGEWVKVGQSATAIIHADVLILQGIS
jgi:hypothetical protein